MEDDAGQREAMLRLRALKLREIVQSANASVGTIAERDLTRARAEIEEALAAIEVAEAPYWAVEDRLRAIAIGLEGPLKAVETMTIGASAAELRSRLAAWQIGSRDP